MPKSKKTESGGGDTHFHVHVNNGRFSDEDNEEKKKKKPNASQALQTTGGLYSQALQNNNRASESLGRNM